MPSPKLCENRERLRPGRVGNRGREPKFHFDAGATSLEPPVVAY
ncbi:hypothetical protein [Edaphobacter sp. HDX4]